MSASATQGGHAWASAYNSQWRV